MVKWLRCGKEDRRFATRLFDIKGMFIGRLERRKGSKRLEGI